jgi:Ca-activated chloride channel homolog
MKRVLAAAFLVTVSSWVTFAAPQQRTPFRGTSEVVAVYATVVDKDTGRLMTDLPKEAFQVLDNGRRQEISVFSNEIQPITVVIMLDRSGSMMPHAEVVQRAAGKFVERMLPDDKARVGDFSHKIQILPETFTSDQRQLQWNLQTNLQTARNGPSPVWWAIERAMTALTSEGGRRVVLAFSDGHDDPSYGQMRTSFKDLQRRVVEDEIMVYAIGVPASVPRNWQGQFGGTVLSGGMKFEPPDPDFRRIAEESGGGYFELDWRENLDEAFERVADELHRQYLIGFTPATMDGRKHEIEVRVNNRDAKVRARRNYQAGRR